MKKLQKKIGVFAKKNKLLNSPETAILDLVSETGEAAKEILKSTDYGRKKFQKRKEIKNELGDVFYSLIILANSQEVDLEEALEEVLEKYRKRLSKGGAGSENENKKR